MAAIEDLLVKYPDLQPIAADIQMAVSVLHDSFHDGGKLLICGNGGSAADSDHIVGELMKGFMLTRRIPADEALQFEQVYGQEGNQLANQLQRALPAISLGSHAALISAISNDTDASVAYAQQVYGYGKAGDVLLGISTSGNSKNVLAAVQVAKVKGLKTIGLTGAAGGRLLDLCDVTVRVPYARTPDVQERHLPIYHAICIALEEAFFAS